MYARHELPANPTLQTALAGLSKKELVGREPAVWTEGRAGTEPVALTPESPEGGSVRWADGGVHPVDGRLVDGRRGVEVGRERVRGWAAVDNDVRKNRRRRAIIS